MWSGRWSKKRLGLDDGGAQQVSRSKKTGSASSWQRLRAS
jgi:hypothetical protein